MNKKTVEINYDNLDECENILKNSRSNISSISSEIKNLSNNLNSNSIYYNYYKSGSIDITEAKELLKTIKNDLHENISEELRRTIALIRMIKIDFSNIEKNSNKKVEISEEKYQKILSKYSNSYNVPNPNLSILKGAFGTGLSSIMGNSIVSIKSDLVAAAQKKKDTNSKKKKSTDNTATNNTSSGTTSKTTRSNSTSVKTNSTVTTSGTTASSAVTTASTNAIATLSLTPSTTNKNKKDTAKNATDKKKKQDEKVPKDTKPRTPKDDTSNDNKKPTNNTSNDNKKPTNNISDDTRKPTNNISDDTRKPTNNISDDTKKPTNNISDDTKNPTNNTPNDNKPAENNTPSDEQISNSNTTSPTNTETKKTVQENQPVQTTANQNTSSNPKRSFVTNTAKNNQSSTIEEISQTPTTETTSPSPSLSDSVSNGNTTNLFDTNVEDFSDIEESISSIGSDSKTGGSGVIPVVAGLGAAATVGIGAKVYKDRKENNDLDLNEDRPSNENKFWTTDDSMVIHSEKDEYDINADYPTTEEPTSYTAIDNSLDEDQKDSWEMPEINNDSQVIDLLGNE